MKRRIIFNIIILLVFAFYYSCEDDIEVFSGEESVPIVYCLLNPYDTVQYVRISRTYIVEKRTNSITSSVDSLYFDGEILIALEYWENDQIKETIKFEQYEGLVKDPGVFPTNKNILFRSFQKIHSESTYKLNIYLKEKEKIIFGEIITVGDIEIIDPNPFFKRKITLSSEQNYAIRFNLAPEAWIYQTVINFNYDEISEEDTIKKSFEWAQKNTKPDFLKRDFIITRLNGAKFFQDLTNELEENPNIKRKAVDFSFKFYYGSADLRFYVESITPSSGVLQEKPTYTNFLNAQGVFSSLSVKEIENIQLSKIMIDSLAHSKLSKNFGFVDSKDSLYIQ